MKDGIARWIAWRLPRRICYYVFIRVCAHATGSEWGHDNAPDMKVLTALERWGI